MSTIDEAELDRLERAEEALREAQLRCQFTISIDTWDLQHILAAARSLPAERRAREEAESRLKIAEDIAFRVVTERNAVETALTTAETEAASLRERVKALEVEVSALRGAFSWVQPPFVDTGTSEAELRKRVQFAVADVALFDRARAAPPLILEEKNDG